LKSGSEVTTTPKQFSLDLGIAREVEVDGIGMGVLSDGTAYLTARGLARLCGVDHTLILQLGQDWHSSSPRPRTVRIKEALRQQGLFMPDPYISIIVDGSPHHAYPEVLCMAVLEYYAFDATQSSRDTALRNYRLLARRSFREFIYAQVGYDPQQLIPAAWRQFHDRVSLVYDSVPAGYFSVFKEIADIVVTLINEGVAIGADFIPDISVGQHWGRHWRENYYDDVYGARLHYEHNYPSYFPQAESNPQAPYCYPDAALGEFRRWIREQYLPNAFPTYLRSKEKQGALPPSFSEIAVKALESRGRIDRELTEKPKGRKG
jgi:hypothetical protein